MPNRFGPTRFGPPFSKVWQAAHFLAAAAPFSTEAVCSSFSIGSAGAAAACLAPPSASPFTAISKPGLAGIWGENSALAVKLVTSSTRQVPSTAPRILLSSKESIVDQAPGRKVEMIRVGRWQRPGGRRNALENAQESDFRNRTPERPRRYRFARSLATRIYAPGFQQPPSIPDTFAGS